MFAENAFDHVADSAHFHIFENVSIHLPFGLSKYKVLLVLAALLIIVIYVPIARRARSGGPPRGGWWNAFESLLTFLRNDVAKPCIGQDADRYVPFLWTTFLFILFCNLFGMFPFLGSPTASFSVTLGLALVTFLFIHGSAIIGMGEESHGHGDHGHGDHGHGEHKHGEPSHDPHALTGHHGGDRAAPKNVFEKFGRGLKPYFKSYLPPLDVPFGLGYVIVPMIAILEFFSNFIKGGVLAVRLFANMFAGHVVLAFLLMFIVMMRHKGIALFSTATFFSVLGVTALSLLELFVAFLQAYVFTFLAALFLGSALHPQH